MAGKSVDREGDADLEELLDSALGDFDKQLADVAASSPQVARIASSGEASTSATTGSPRPVHSAASAMGPSAYGGFPDPSAAWMSAFGEELSGDAGQNLDAAMKELMSGNPELEQLMRGLHGAMNDAKAGGEGSGPAPNVDAGSVEANLAQALEGLQENVKKLQESVPSGDDAALLNALKGMGMENSADGIAESMPLMETMMKSLLSKDVIYPSLKDLSGKLRSWLEDHGDVAEEERHRYSRQLEIMTAVVDEYDKETAADSSAVTQERYERVLALMQEMQQYGHPPEEVMGEVPGMEGGSHPMFMSPGMPNEQCSIM